MFDAAADGFVNREPVAVPSMQGVNQAVQFLSHLCQSLGLSRPIVRGTLTSDIQATTVKHWVPGNPWDNHADYWRRSKQEYELPASLSVAGPSIMGIELAEALDELPEQAQQILLLRYHVGLSVAEIAEVLGRSYKATESLLSRVRRQFHHAFVGVEA